MENINISNIKIPAESLGIPEEYLFCFQSECSRCQTCAHYVAGGLARQRKTAQTVLSAACSDGKCPWYKEFRTIRAAYGTKAMLGELKAKDASVVRYLIKDYLGGNGTYYDYQHGRKVLTPEQQDWIKALLRRYGYTGMPDFDNYRDTIDW